MSAKVRVKVLRAFMLDRDTVAEVGQVLDLDALVVYSLDRSKAEILGDPERAKMLINAAAKVATAAAERACGRSPLDPAAQRVPAGWFSHSSGDALYPRFH